MTAAPRCFREQLALLEELGEVRHVTRRVSPRFEVAGVAKRLDGGPVLVFDDVEGHDMPVVIGIDADRRRIARSYGETPLSLIDRYMAAIDNPVAPEIVGEGPVQEVVVEPPFDVAEQMPILTHYEHDGGPYLTTGIVIAEDPDRGVRNMSYHRLQITGPLEMRGLFVPRHLRAMFEAAEARDEPLPLAVVLGMDSAQRLAAATWGSAIPLGMDELGISGALKGRPEQLVPCKTIPVHVPAHAEIVLECLMLPGERREEGPFAEFTGNYGPKTQSPILRIQALTRRADPLCQAMVAFTAEHHHLLGMPYEPVVLRTVRGVLPATAGVHITNGGCGKFHAVVSIAKKHPGDGKDAILAALHAIRDIKQVTVVDDDVDPFDPKDVEWAVSTRFQADRDLVVISGAKGNELDPSTRATGAVTAKMGIDATKPLEGGSRFEKVRIPGEDAIDPGDYLA
ncbi:MAG TPA: UbiD family decarboxylase [Solirubrobacter sp.]|nr:UbiD family decarboxylase [Solirubrobacter sp.]